MWMGVSRERLIQPDKERKLVKRMITGWNDAARNTYRLDRRSLRVDQAGFLIFQATRGHAFSNIDN
jgi:hypothetical protein